MTSEGRTYWERHAKRYDRSTAFLSRPVPRMLELAVEAAKGRARVLEVAAGTGLPGFPGQRRFTSTSLTAAIEGAGLRVENSETISGRFPVGFVRAV